MTSTRRDVALASGITASAATLGVLIGLGRASADPFFALAAGGHLWFGASLRAEWPYVFAGAARHLLLVSPLGAAVALAPWSRRHLVEVALAVAGVAVLAVPYLPDLIRPLALDLSWAERVVTWMALSGGLVLGARLAPDPST